MEIKCTRCSYEWRYKGVMLLVTCPCCGSKVKNVEQIQKLKL